MTLRDIAAVAFDLDGTLYFGDTAALGGREVVEWLLGRGVHVEFFTNASGITHGQTVAKLVRLGYPATDANTLNSAYATARFVRGMGLALVGCIGEDGLRTELVAAGVACTSDLTSAQALVVGLVRDCEALRAPVGVAGLPPASPIIVANLDMSFPVGGGVRRPGCGEVARRVSEWTGRRIDHVVGKPSTYMLELMTEKLGIEAREVLVVGDSLDSDIAMAQAAGAPSVLVDAQGSESPPTGVARVRDMEQLLAWLEQQEMAEGSLNHG